jgi:hypothetical protein
MSVKDRVSTAAEATAASVREIRPLTLPESSAVSAERRGHRGRSVPRVGGTLVRIKQTWAIPLAAAAVVVALALSLVILRHSEAPTQVGPVAPAAVGVPQYYAMATEEPASHARLAAINVTVVDVRTGKTLTTVKLPTPDLAVGINAAVGVSAAADDRTFVVGSMNEYTAVTYFLVHIAPGAKQVATFEKLPIPLVNLGVLLGLAVSPDGKDLAVLSMRGNGTTLRIYSVKSGATLRTWRAATWENPYFQNPQGTTVSWTADNRQVAFSRVLYTSRNSSAGALEERLIGVTEPSGDLASTSKVVFKAPGNCSSLLLTPDGGTVVCATASNYGFPSSPAGCGTNGPMFVSYSAATGKRLRVLYQYPGACQSGLNTVLWSDDSAQHVIGERQITFQDHPLHYTDGYGVAAAGKFTQFPFRQLGQWYSGPAF